ncbi:MAG: helix-hairpin-helix domain-containing protein [Bacteroidia bacterium]
MDRLISILNIPTFERRALIALLFFALFIVLIKRYQKSRISENVGLSEVELEILKFKLDSLLNASHEVNYRMFNPNEDSLDSLLAKGLPSNIAYNIVNYRTKVGPFENPEDLIKLYSIDSSLWQKLQLFIELPESKVSFSVQNERQMQPRDLNQCTAADLETIRGIGPVLSKRIISYRNILGGYYSIYQLKEVYGIEEELFLKVKPYITIHDSVRVSRINLNKVEFKTLLKHPYWNYQQVKSLINYRRRNSKIENVEELIKVDIMSKSEFERVLPYIEL